MKEIWRPSETGIDKLQVLLSWQEQGAPERFLGPLQGILNGHTEGKKPIKFMNFKKTKNQEHEE